MSHKRRCITYRIEVVGPHNEHTLDTVAEWGLDGLIELFSQEGYTVKHNDWRLIERRRPSSEPLPPVPDSILRTGTKPPPARRQRPPKVPPPRRA